MHGCSVGLWSTSRGLQCQVPSLSASYRLSSLAKGSLDPVDSGASPVHCRMLNSVPRGQDTASHRCNSQSADVAICPQGPRCPQVRITEFKPVIVTPTLWGLASCSWPPLAELEAHAPTVFTLFLQRWPGAVLKTGATESTPSPVSGVVGPRARCNLAPCPKEETLASQSISKSPLPLITPRDPPLYLDDSGLQRSGWLKRELHHVSRERKLALESFGVRKIP